MPRHVKDLSLAHVHAARKDDGTLEPDALTRPSFSDLFLARIHGVAFLQPLAGNRTAGGNNAGYCAAHDPRLVIKPIHRVPSAKDLKDLPPKEGQED
jgi:hypothetical protein